MPGWPYSWLTLAASDERQQLRLHLLDRCQWVFFPRVELLLQGHRLIGGIGEIWQVLDETDPPGARVSPRTPRS